MEQHVNFHSENSNEAPPEAKPEQTDMLRSQGLTYTQKSKKLEDARSSSWLFIVFGAVGLLLILAVWLGLIPLNLALYMKVLYTIVLGSLFVIFIILGVHYKRKIKGLESETTTERMQTEEIVSFFTEEYPLEALDKCIDEENLSMEQLYFARYEKLSALIQEKYGISDGAYLDFLIEKIYESYSTENQSVV